MVPIVKRDVTVLFLPLSRNCQVAYSVFYETADLVMKNKEKMFVFNPLKPRERYGKDR
jgi:hypothetical protein